MDIATATKRSHIKAQIRALENIKEAFNDEFRMPPQNANKGWDGMYDFLYELNVDTLKLVHNRIDQKIEYYNDQLNSLK
jgi:hypothetical protein